MRGLFYCTIVHASLCFLPAIPALAAADSEPNDTIENSVPTGLQLWNTVVVSGGRIGDGPLGAADRDIFSFEIAPEVVLPVHLTARLVTTGGDLDGYVRVFNSAGVDVARLDDSDGTIHPVLRTYLLEPGVFYVGVSDALNPAYWPIDAQSGRAAKTGEYELALTLWHAPSMEKSLELDDDAPIMVNELPFVAERQFIGDGPILEPDGLSGDFRLDEDLYRLHVDAASILSITVTPEPSEALDPDVRVFLGGDFPQELDGFESVANTTRTRHIELALPAQPDPVDIVIRGTVDPPSEQNRRYGSVGFYDVRIDLQAAEDAGGPHEPNDSVLLATPTGLVDSNTVTFSGFIGDGEYGRTRGDLDAFQASLRQQSVLKVDLRPVDGSDLNPVAVLYDREGLELARWHADADREIHAEHSVSCKDLAWFYKWHEWRNGATLAVMGAGDRVLMDPFVPAPLPTFSWPYYYYYGIRYPLSRYLLDGGPGSTGAYELTLARAPSPCDDEPNDTIPDATETSIVDSGEFSCFGVPAGNGPCDSGDIEESRDVDLYQVHVVKAPRRLDVSLKTCSALAGTVRLFDADGNELDAAEMFWSERRTPPEEITLSAILESVGEYFIGVSAFRADSYDPFQACSAQKEFTNDDGDRFAYDIDIRMSAPEGASVAAAAGAVADGEVIQRLFAARMDPFPETIVELDPDSGDTLNELPAPEVPLGGGEGIAFDGTDVRVMGSSSRFPFLYRLDSDTGDVLDRRIAWFGSGFYGGMALLGGNLYVVDLLEDAIWVVTRDLDRVVRKLDVGRLNGVSMFGAIAAQAAPARLVVPDAASPSKLHVLDASDGRRLTTLNLGGACLCDADFDGDGDVDAGDRAFLDDCARLIGVAFGCAAADLNCDGAVDAADGAIFTCQANGPSLPPNGDCCAEDLPPSSIRATGVAVTGVDTLVAADWAVPSATLFDGGGTPLRTIRLAAPAGAMGGTAFAKFGDFDGDGNVDLMDWRHLQICFTAAAREPPITGCEVFDFDGDDRLDLFDYAAFFDAMTGARP